MGEEFKGGGDDREADSLRVSLPLVNAVHGRFIERDRLRGAFTSENPARALFLLVVVPVPQGTMPAAPVPPRFPFLHQPGKLGPLLRRQRGVEGGETVD